MSNKKKLLIISAFFPPVNHIASRRGLAFAKYLSDTYDVIVVTKGSKNESLNYPLNEDMSIRVFYIKDRSLWKRALSYNGKESSVSQKLKTITRIVFNKLSISHHYVWRRDLQKKVLRLIQQEKIDVMLSSYAPEDVLEASYNALMLSNSTELTWVLDFRDEYSAEQNLSRITFKNRRKKEIKYSKRANILTTISEPHLNQFKNDLPGIPKYIELNNGYDHSFSQNYCKGDFFKIGYFGNFYGKRKPDAFFKALLQIESLNDIEVYIATKIVNFDIPEKLKNHIHILDFMSEEESIRKMASMDCNLLLHPKTSIKGVYSGKLFDYISVQRSVLAIVDSNDVAADLITNMNCGYVADFDNSEKIKGAILQAYSDWNKNELRVASNENIEKIHRKYQVEKLKKALIE